MVYMDLCGTFGLALVCCVRGRYISARGPARRTHVQIGSVGIIFTVANRIDANC